jgi:hypothetical protein
MRYIFSFILICTLLISCEKCFLPGDTDWQEGVIYFTGELALDGCGWLLLSEGESYHVKSLDEEFMVDGLDVWFKANDIDETFTCGLGGTQFAIKEISQMKEKPWKVRYLSDYPGRETSMDMFTLDSVFIDGDSLRLHVGYSGGCAIHQFNLWALETGMDREGDLHIMLEHIGNGDLCEAYPWEWLAFSLVPLQEEGRNSVTFWLRGSPLMSMIFGPYTYEY